MSTSKRQGKGPPVILLHGIGANKDLWPETLNVLGENFSIYTCDLPGHGSATGEANMNLDAMVNSMCEELDQLGLERFHLVGVSLGASVAIKLIQCNRFHVLSLFVASLGLAPEEALSDEVYGTREALHYLTEQNFAEQMGEALLIPDAPPKSVEALRDSIRQMGKNNFLKSLQTLAEDGLAQDVQKVGCPITVIRGELDEFISPQNAQSLASRLGSTAVIELVDTGHLANLDNPTEFSNVVENWLVEQ